MSSAQADPVRLHYLDGLRGWAALIVVFYHSTWELFKSYAPQMRTSKLGLLNDGKIAVYVFFVLSGLVLAYPYLMRRQRRVIAITAVRRYPRLVVPIAAAALVTYLLMRLGLLFNVQAGHIVGSDQWLGTFYRHTPSLRSWFAFSFFDVFFRYDNATSYDFVLWTMPYELAGSFIVFGMLAVGGRWLVARLICYAVAAALCRHFEPVLFSFVVGAICAEFTLSPPCRYLARRPIGDWLGLACMAVGFAASVMLRATYSPKRCAWIALLIVLSAVFSPRFRAMLETRFSRFLGRISFPLFLMHSIVICGPSSLLIVLLDRMGWGRFGVVAVVVPATMLLSVAVAILFSPFERLGIRVSHALSSWPVLSTQMLRLRRRIRPAG